VAPNPAASPPGSPEFVAEVEEEAAEWRDGQTQGDHLMFAKARRQSTDNLEKMGPPP